MKRFEIGSISAAMVLFLGTGAFAHPGHPESGFGGGFVHPFSGVDHLLAMIAVGLWAVQLGGRAICWLPVSFVGLMIGGGLLAKAGVHIGDPDPFITASLFVLGLMVAVSAKLPTAAGAALVGLFAIFHGYAHVREGVVEQGHSMVFFAGGFVLATITLHAVGIGIGLSLGGKTGATWVRIAGVGIAACAGLIAVGWVQT